MKIKLIIKLIMKNKVNNNENIMEYKFIENKINSNNNK